MSFLENPKSRYTSIASTIAAGASAHSSLHLKPGCVQCGSLIEITERKRTNFSGKCDSCANWVFDEDEPFDELED